MGFELAICDSVETVSKETVQQPDWHQREPDGSERRAHWSDSEWETRLVEQRLQYAAGH